MMCRVCVCMCRKHCMLRRWTCGRSAVSWLNSLRRRRCSRRRALRSICLTACSSCSALPTKLYGRVSNTSNLRKPLVFMCNRECFFSIFFFLKKNSTKTTFIDIIIWDKSFQKYPMQRLIYWIGCWPMIQRNESQLHKVQVLIVWVVDEFRQTFCSRPHIN